MKIVAVLTHDVHPDLLQFLKAPTVNKAEVNPGEIVFEALEPESLVSDIRAYARRIEEINRVMQQAGHYQVAADVLSGHYHNAYKGSRLHSGGPLADIIRSAAGKDLSDEQIDFIFRYVTSQLRLRRYDGKKNSFQSVLQELKEATKLLTLSV